MVSHREAGLPLHRHTVDWPVGIGLALAAFGLYLATLAPTVLEADGGEFQFVPWLPGIAHPTGYPLYVLLGWLWTHVLPVGEVAWRMNLLSAVLAAAAVGLAYAVARQLGDRTLPDTPISARIIAAVIAATTFAVGHAFWSQAIIAEVYALHALFVVGMLWLALGDVFSSHVSVARNSVGISPPDGDRNDMKGKLLALTFGLSLTHHRTIVLLLPALALYLLTADRRPQTGDILFPGPRSPVPGHSWRSWLLRAVLLTAPLLLYLYLPLVAPYTPYTTLMLGQNQPLILYDNSFQGFWNHIMGSVFSGDLQPAAAGVDRLELSWQLLRQQVGWVGVLLAMTGLITLWQRRQIDLLLLTGAGFVAFVVFNLIYFIGDVFVLFIPAWLFVALWVGLGGLGLAHWLARNFVQSKTGSVNSSPAVEALERRLGRRVYHFVAITLTTLGLLLPVVLLVTRYGEINQTGNVAARDRWQAILAEPLPEGAILLSNDRNEIMPLWYYQYVESRRPDLLGLFPLIVTDPAYANVGRVLDQALASGRPVYLIKPMAGLELKADLSPAGLLVRAVANQTPPAHLVNTTLPGITIPATSNGPTPETVTLLGYDLAPAKLIPGAPITVTLHWQATQVLSIDYTSYVHLVNGSGQGVAQNDHRPGGDFYPSHYWQTGEVVRDQHILTVPDTASPGEYRLRVGMYYQPEPGVIAGMGDGVEIGPLTVK